MIFGAAGALTGWTSELTAGARPMLESVEAGRMVLGSDEGVRVGTELVGVPMAGVLLNVPGIGAGAVLGEVEFMLRDMVLEGVPLQPEDDSVGGVMLVRSPEGDVPAVRTLPMLGCKGAVSVEFGDLAMLVSGMVPLGGVCEAATGGCVSTSFLRQQSQSLQPASARLPAIRLVQVIPRHPAIRPPFSANRSRRANPSASRIPEGMPGAGAGTVSP